MLQVRKGKSGHHRWIAKLSARYGCVFFSSFISRLFGTVLPSAAPLFGRATALVAPTAIGTRVVLRIFAKTQRSALVRNSASPHVESHEARPAPGDLSWKIRSARDRTIRTFHIRVRSKFCQNSVHLLWNSKNSGFFNIFENICEIPTKFHQTPSKI